MTTDQLREQLTALYPDSRAWAARVKRMSDPQVLAIWFRISNGKKSK